MTVLADGTGTGGDGAAIGDTVGAPTIYDVARAAGVSIASVSRVLNGRRNPRPETTARVQRAVAELGFVPDSAARALSVRLKEVCLLYTSDAADDLLCVDLGGRRIIKKKKKQKNTPL